MTHENGQWNHWHCSMKSAWHVSHGSCSREFWSLDQLKPKIRTFEDGFTAQGHATFVTSSSTVSFRIMLYHVHESNHYSQETWCMTPHDLKPSNLTFNSSYVMFKWNVRLSASLPQAALCSFFSSGVRLIRSRFHPLVMTLPNAQPNFFKIAPCALQPGIWTRFRPGQNARRVTLAGHSFQPYLNLQLFFHSKSIQDQTTAGIVIRPPFEECPSDGFTVSKQNQFAVS